jgi:hypothetical protein
VQALKSPVGFKSERDYRRRNFRQRLGQLERLKQRRKISKIAFSWVKGTLDFSF